MTSVASILITNYRVQEIDRKNLIMQYLDQQQVKTENAEYYYYEFNNSSGNFGILEQLIAKFQLTNYVVNYHVLLNSHFLKDRDWTLLLKSLEELPEKQVILIQTDYLQFLPETIISRLPIKFITDFKFSNLNNTSKLNLDPIQVQSLKIENLLADEINKLAIFELKSFINKLDKIARQSTLLPQKTVDLELELCI